MSANQVGAAEVLLPSVVFLYDQEPSDLLRKALDRIKSDRSVQLHEVPATAVTCECFQRIRVPALLLYNSDGVETAAAVGDNSIISLIERQF